MTDVVKTPFVHNIGGAGVIMGALAVMNPTITITGGDFVLVKMSGIATVAASSIIQIQDSAQGGGNWFLQPMIIDELFGAPGLPYRLAMPRLLPNRAVISCTITDIIAGSTVWLSFHGYSVTPSAQTKRGI